MTAEGSGRVAVVTGASRGIGEAIARRLARSGHSVVVNYSASPAAAEAVVAGIVAEGGAAIAHQADGIADAPDAVHAGTQRHFGVVVFGEPELQAFHRHAI